jgi:hypothetical protein
MLKGAVGKCTNLTAEGAEEVAQRSHLAPKVLISCSDTKWGGQEAEGECDRQIDHFQHAVDGDSDDAEREQDQPDERVGDQGQQGQRPA